MPFYLDTSCLLKVLFPEPETARTLELIATEERVVVSTLAHIEALTHIHGRVAGGLLSAAAANRLWQRMDALLTTAPYDVMKAPTTIYEIAVDQLRPLVRSRYCRTLDRLHLGTMEALRVRRLLTNDDVQAAAAKSLGFSVTLPR